PGSGGARARRGVPLLRHYRPNRTAAEATRQAVAGGGHSLTQADLPNPESIERLWREAAARQPTDTVINNAGIYSHHPPLATAYADWTAAWQRTLATNLSAPAHLSYCAARTMAERGHGRIVGISSRGAFP